MHVGSESPDAAGEIAPTIESSTSSVVAQVIGRTLVVYRRRQNKPDIELPKARGPR